MWEEKKRVHVNCNRWGEWHWKCRIMTYWTGMVDHKMGGNFMTMSLQSGNDMGIVKMGRINGTI